MTPSFQFQGGKARIRNWLCNLFPHRGGRYIELFAGRGNVFFEACQRLHYQRWELYDNDVKFLAALKIADLDQLPTTIRFDDWKNDPSLIAKVLEPIISFSGKGYEYGAQGKNVKNFFRYGNYRANCEKAQVLLNGVFIAQQLWDQFPFDALTKNDFIYLDPPYYNTEGPYPNIDHFKLCQTLSGLDCKWALSGYASVLYERNLIYKQRFEIQRNAEMKGSNRGFGSQVVEVLWRNYL